ncbi:Detected protein of unknown function [Hibiscus syriacus]|uniref:ABC transporter domain-containing protein n=1 Tax=Hibiscus syriacus TaxID=106335 RepID=A0A6A2WS01_HIBSY|nr:Detected protein of unknown function [Hibiscus syriacus]
MMSQVRLTNNLKDSIIMLERITDGLKGLPILEIVYKEVATEGHEANVITDYMLRVLGLEVCANTMVRDEMSRAISGGQKKRVTTGEMIVRPANALFIDEISTGLDSSTTFRIANCLKHSVHILNGIAVISLLQKLMIFLITLFYFLMDGLYIRVLVNFMNEYT